MLDIKYYKDYRHNYLILKDNGCLSENVYQRKMVTENRIKGLLGSQERFINGEILLYYEITSRQSLFSIYDGRSIGMEPLKRLFLQLKLVNDLLQKYLLDAGCLVLQPEYIFEDIETGEYSFLYYPDPEEGGFSQLLDFLMDRVDNEDTNAVETVYKIADLISREQFVLDEVLKWFQDDVSEGAKKQGRDVIGQSLYTGTEREETEFSDGREEENDVYGNAEPLEDCGEKNEADRYLVFKKLISVWGAALLAGGLLFYIKISYRFSYQEEMYLIIGMAALGAIALGTTIWFVYTYCFREKRQEQRGKEGEPKGRYVPTYENDIPVPVSDAGNTVYIPWTENCENKLYSMDRKNKCHIDLGKLPLTVGKLAGAVDMVINEKSISRMHAKFSRTGGSIYITDLNSTNGTFRNGMRLMPNASEVIEPGDEIRLGKLKFIYR